MKIRRFLTAALAAALALSTSALVAPPAVASEAPALVDILGGPGHAEVYPSGMEIAGNGSIVLADTGNDQVRKYRADGTLVWSTGTTGSGVGEFSNPRDVGIDSAGNIYVADNLNRRIVKLSSSGDWITSFSGRTVGFSPPIGVTVKGNRVYLPDLTRVVILDLAGNLVGTVDAPAGSACVIDRPRDVDADAAGNLYVANYLHNNVLKLSPTGACLAVIGTGGSGPGQLKNPYGVKIGRDPVLGRDIVYVADSGNNRLQMFETAGGPLGIAGSEGFAHQPGTFTELRRVAVARDGSGDVWGADLWGNRAERFRRTPAGWEYAQTVGGTGAPLTDAEVFNEPRRVAFEADGTLQVVDTVNQRLVRMTPAGAVLGACGRRGFSPGEFNWPRGVAVDHATGNTWVADTKQSRLQLIAPACGRAIIFGSKGTGTTNFQFDNPHDIAIRQSDRTAWVVDTGNHRIKTVNVATRKAISSYGSLGSSDGAFNSPRGVAVAPGSGHIFVADTLNDRVVELAGTGSSVSFVRSYRAGFDGPHGVAVDSEGRIFVADTGNSRVVVLEADGSVLATIAGPGPDGFAKPEQVAVDSGDRLYVADTYNDRIAVYSFTEGSSIPSYVRDAMSPGLASMYPVEVAATPTRWYAVDPGRYQIVAVDRASGEIVDRVGGTRGSAPGLIAAARSIETDSAGNVYVADTPNNRIEKFDANLDFVREWGSKGSGPGQFDMPYGVAAGIGIGRGGVEDEVMYVVDRTRVQKYTLDGELLGNFTAGTTLREPRQVAVHPITHDVYLVNARARQIIVFDQFGTERFRFGSDGSGPGQFEEDMRGITISEAGDVYVSDPGNSRIHRFTSAGRFVSAFGSLGTGPGQFIENRGIAAHSGVVLVADEWDFSLKEFTADGTFIRRLFGERAPVTGANSPRGMAVDPSGRLYSTDWWNQRIVRRDADGANPMAFGFRGGPTEPGSINFAWDIALQPGTNRIFVANRENHEVEVFTADGAYVNRFASRGTGPGQLQFPQGIAFAPDGTLLVTDSLNDRVNRYQIQPDGSGVFLESFGTSGSVSDGPGRLDTPTGISVEADGTVWLADTANSSIQKRSPTGVWTRYTEAGGAGAFTRPWGVTVAPDGSIWVADTNNDRIVKMTVVGESVFALRGEDLGATALDAPFDIAFAPSGAIYVSDVWNNRVIELR